MSPWCQLQQLVTRLGEGQRDGKTKTRAGGTAGGGGGGGTVTEWEIEAGERNERGAKPVQQL